MGKVFRLALFLFAAIAPFGAAGTANAQEFNHVIKVYASVAEQRGLYVDKDGNIVKIAGNTAKNVEPQVFTLNNQLIPMNDSIFKQYQDFLKSHNYLLQAGKTYVIKHQEVVVNTIPNSQDIEVDPTPTTQDLTLSL